MKHCLKKNRGEINLSNEKKEYNRKISKKRIMVENHFADLNTFFCLRHVYQGNVEVHANAVLCCELFLYWIYCER